MACEGAVKNKPQQACATVKRWVIFVRGEFLLSQLREWEGKVSTSIVIMSLVAIVEYVHSH